MDAVKDRLSRRRREMLLSQVELAAEVGISVCTLTKYEQGRATPNLAYATMLADFMGVSLDWLAGRTEVREMAGWVEC